MYSVQQVLDTGEFVRMEGDFEIYSVHGELYRVEIYYCPREISFVTPYNLDGVPCLTENKPESMPSYN